MALLYKKRTGTSGIGGDLYKIKVTSLIQLRLLYDETIENFHLACNMEGIGPFGDICLKLKVKGSLQTIYIFIHVKHKDDKNSNLNFDAIKSFYDSFVKVTQNINTKKTSFFTNNYYNPECIFVLYTNAKYFEVPTVQLEQSPSNATPKPRQDSFGDKLNEIIATTDKVSQNSRVYTDKDLEYISDKILEEELAVLADNLVQCFIENKSMDIMSNEHIFKYHIILATSVFIVSEIKGTQSNSGDQNVNEAEWRELTFLPDFFYTQDKILSVLRQNIYESVIKRYDIQNTHTYVNDASSAADSDNSEQYNLESMDRTITYAQEILLFTNVKVPVTFGNIDILLEKAEMDIATRQYLFLEMFTAICSIAKLIDPFKIVTLDEYAGRLMFSPNLMGSLIGNLLVHDNVTKLLMVTEKFESLQNNARTLFNNLKSKIPNLLMYRFDVSVIVSTLPKLSFDYTEEAKVILNKIKIYDKQSTIEKFDEKLENKIKDIQKTNDPHNLPVDAKTATIYYLNEIQNWWVVPDLGPYFTKAHNIYQRTINDIIKEPQTTAMQTTIYMNMIKYNWYKFSENAIDFLKTLYLYSRNIIVSSIFLLTTVKVLQYLRNIYNNKYTVLNVDYVLKLTDKDFTLLNAELTKSEKGLIIVCDNTKSSRLLYKRLDVIAQATENKKVIVITDRAFIETAQDYFSCAYSINDENQSLIDLTPESQENVLKTTVTHFQGLETNLDLIVDGVSVAFINNAVLHKIVYNETLLIGNVLSNTNYEEIKHLYVDRRLSQKDNSDLSFCNIEHECSTGECNGNVHTIKTFYGIPKEVVLVTARPGMGKSTLVTHLSLETKKRNIKLWILRVNLLDHSKMLFDLHKHKRVINTLKTLKFLCQVLLKNTKLPINLKENNSNVYLDGCTGDEWATFELNMFLHYYNERNLFLVFDGFDEICPYYKTVVLKFLNAVKNYPRQQKIWVTSKTCEEILPELQKVVSDAYEIDSLSYSEQDTYLNKYWQDKIIVEKLSDGQLRNMISFIDFMVTKNNLYLSRIFYIFYEYFNCHLQHIEICSNNLRERVTSIADYYLVNDEDDIVMNTPLLLYLYADYLVKLIYDELSTANWKLNTEFSTLSVFEKYIELLLQDRNKKNIYKPDMRRRFKRDYAYYVAMHKKIAAHALILHRIPLDELKSMNTFYEQIEYDATINEIKYGIEKSGIISHIDSDNLPVFIYRPLGEYFAAEFICDIFKSEEFEFNSKNFVYSVAKSISSDIFTWIDKKRKVDEQLDYILNDIEQRRPQELNDCSRIFAYDWSIEHVIRIQSSTLDDYKSDCFAEYNVDFMNTLQQLDEEHRKLRIKEIQYDIVAKMKPHIKRYFASDEV